MRNEHKVVLALALVCGSSARSWGEGRGGSRAFDIDHLQLAVISGTFPGIEDAAPARPWEWRAGLAFRYLDHPLMADVNGQSSTLVSSRTLANVTGGVALGRRFGLGVDVPVLLAQSGSEQKDGVALGDVRFVGRFTAFSVGALRGGVLLGLRVPTGDTSTFLGQGSVVVEPAFALGWSSSRIRVAANVGGRFRGEQTFGDRLIGQELSTSVGVGVLAHRYVDVFGEAHASFPLIAHPTTADIPIEVLAGLGTRVGPVDARVGAGAGLVEGYGNPRFRVLFTVSYAPGEKVAPPMLVKAEPAPKAPRIAWKEPRSPAPAAWDEPDLDPDGDIDPDEPDVEVDHDFLTLAQPVFFDSNRAHIHAQFRGELQEMARVLLKRPTLPVVWIEGHSDTQGSEDLNLGVSRQRAERVRAYLIERGVPADRLRVLAAGESRPWFSNRQERGRARNRRVMFFLQRGADPEPGQLPVVLAPPATSTKGAPQRSAMMQTNETASTAAGGDQ